MPACHSRKGGPRVQASRLALAIAWLAILFSSASAQPAGAANAAEAQVQAAYIYKFIGFAEWPEGTFSTPDEPLVIGVIGADDIAAELEGLVAGRAVERRRLEIRRLSDDKPIALHVLVIGSLGRSALDRILDDVRGDPVLVVSRERIAEAPEVMINFVTLQQRVRFEVALASAARSRIRFSALMLSAAHRVNGEQP